jgi:rubrerythrin
MHDMTKQNLEAAFAGESQAHMKYLVFADVAEKEGLANTARMFRAIALAERIHATNHLKALGGIGKTPENLKAAMGGENYEVDEMYPAFKAVAEIQGEKRAMRYMDWAMEAEKIHAVMYEKAREAALAGNDVEVPAIFVCDACGWTVEGEAPDVCPICGVKHDRFIRF